MWPPPYRAEPEAQCPASPARQARAAARRGRGAHRWRLVTSNRAPVTPACLQGPVVARLKGAESIPHESVCLGVHLPRHPADADALEPSDETARNFVQLTEMCLSHRGDTVYLVHHELRVHVDPDSLDSVIARKLQSLDQRLVLRHVVGGRTDRLRDLIHGDQTARSQERTNRRAAQRLSGVAPISVEKVVPAFSGPRPALRPRPQASPARTPASRRAGRGARSPSASRGQARLRRPGAVGDRGRGEQVSGHLGRRQLAPGRLAGLPRPSHRRSSYAARTASRDDRCQSLTSHAVHRR